MNGWGDYAYDQYLAEVAEMETQDRELRFHVLDSAVAVEHEFLSTAAFYLGGGNTLRQELADRLIGDWGGMRAATGIVETALEIHGEANRETETWFKRVQKLMDLRHCLAHGTSESWQANPPERRDGRLGRELRARTRSGRSITHWIDFEEAEETVAAGRHAAMSLSRLLADVMRQM